MKKSLLLTLFSIVSILGIAQIPYGSNHGKYITIKGAKVYYEEYGKGTPLLLLHGGFGSIKDFKQVIGTLSKKYRVLALDSPGQGRSEQIAAISYQIYADYYAAFIDQMKLDSVYVLGWSDGGNSAFILAHDRPDKVKKVIASGSDSDMFDAAPAGFVENMKTRTPENISEEYRQYWLNDFLKLSPNKNTWQKSFIQLRDMWVTKEVISDEHLRSIKSKFLVVYGDKDVIKLEHGLHIYRTIPSAQLLILPNTSHMVFSEKPALISQLIVEFLGK
ncbi:alpha/beta hydrolase [Sandaracinomonas limnophila]|uniref:Alpha/beta hydrolase n=1 Tax=Sandaracinomonas limnophila TaxID=1862386 RepID=A0A437PPG7_9BACT|nr:alpha/beta hydrolase [Sandaracinomonas limnophila]RVU24127.1 alpha/beta hydrolase [Sandaracinomonas limnophila]